MWWLLKSLGQLGPTRWYLMDGGMGGGEGGYKGGGGWGSSIPCTGMHRSDALGPPPLLISSHSKLNLVFFLFLQPGAGEGILGIQVLSNRSNPAKGTIGIQAHVTLRPQVVLYSPSGETTCWWRALPLFGEDFALTSGCALDQVYMKHKCIFH